MSEGTFTLEIFPQNYYQAGNNVCTFNLTIDVATIDVANSAPAIASSSAGVTSTGWSSAAQTWYDPSNAYAYYPYYYNSGYYSQYNAPSPNAGSQVTGYSLVPVTPPPPRQNEESSTSISSRNPLISSIESPKELGQVPPPDPSQPRTIPKNQQHGKRLPTPHPRKLPAGLSRLADTSTALQPKSPASATPEKLPRACLPPQPSASLAACLQRLSQPKRSVYPTREAGNSSGKPIWSGNFSGANSPAKTNGPCKPKPGPFLHKSGPFPGSRTAPIISDGSTSIDFAGISKKAHCSNAIGAAMPTTTTAAAGASAATKPSGSTASSSNGGCSSSSPIVQYVSYNYRPVLVQSPPNNLAGLPRLRTTSTLEAILS